MGLIDDLAAFLAEQRRCGLLEGGMEGRIMPMCSILYIQTAPSCPKLPYLRATRLQLKGAL
jgi:hypothetical protein